ETLAALGRAARLFTDTFDFPLRRSRTAGAHAEILVLAHLRADDVSALAAVTHGRGGHGDRIAHLHHALAVTIAVHVVGTVTLEPHGTGALVVLQLDDQAHVRVDRGEVLHQTGVGHRPVEVELH